MKKVIIFLSILICIALQVTGCTKQKTDKITEVSTKLYLDYNKVECIQYEIGGIPRPGVNKPLFPENNSEKISNILNLVNNNNGYEEISEQTKSANVYEKRPPNSVNIYMKDKNSYRISGWYTNKQESSVDKVLFQGLKNGEIQYYVLSSKKLVDYLHNQSILDMPTIKAYSYISENINTGEKISSESDFGSNKIVKGGEKLTITGDGVISKEVNIVLLSQNSHDKYIIAKVKADLGKWNWQGIINKNIKTFDGKAIYFNNDKYVVSYEADGTSVIGYCSDIIDITK